MRRMRRLPVRDATCPPAKYWITYQWQNIVQGLPEYAPGIWPRQRGNNRVRINACCQVRRVLTFQAAAYQQRRQPVQARRACS